MRGAFTRYASPRSLGIHAHGYRPGSRALTATRAVGVAGCCEVLAIGAAHNASAMTLGEAWLASSLNCVRTGWRNQWKSPFRIDCETRIRETNFSGLKRLIGLKV